MRRLIFKLLVSEGNPSGFSKGSANLTLIPDLLSRFLISLARHHIPKRADIYTAGKTILQLVGVCQLLRRLFSKVLPLIPSWRELEVEADRPQHLSPDGLRREIWADGSPAARPPSNSIHMVSTKPP